MYGNYTDNVKGFTSAGTIHMHDRNLDAICWSSMAQHISAVSVDDAIARRDARTVINHVAPNHLQSLDMIDLHINNTMDLLLHVIIYLYLNGAKVVWTRKWLLRMRNWRTP